ncbi:MAG: PH domain-containing protein [Candidatus Micrarchaeia archaeon]
MNYSFHPSPIVAIVQSVIVAGGVAAAAYLIRDFLGDILMPLIVLMASLCLIKILLSFISSQTYTITLDESSITYTHGILSRKQFVVPFSKVTESSFDQSLVQRFFGLGTLFADTPGGSESAIRLQDARMSDIELTLAKIKAKNK